MLRPFEPKFYKSRRKVTQKFSFFFWGGEEIGSKYKNSVFETIQRHILVRKDVSFDALSAKIGVRGVDSRLKEEPKN